MLNHRSMLAAFGAAILSVLLVASTEAWDNGNRTNYLTFSRPFALPGVVLPSGTYIFELVDPEVPIHVVRVMSRDRSRVYLTAHTLTIRRPAGLAPDQDVSLGEVPRGVTPPVTAWYPIGDSIGHQFIYAKGSPQLMGRVGT